MKFPIEVGSPVMVDMSTIEDAKDATYQSGRDVYLVTEIRSGLIFISGYRNGKPVPFKIEKRASSEDDMYGWPEKYLYVELS